MSRSLSLLGVISVLFACGSELKPQQNPVASSSERLDSSPSKDGALQSASEKSVSAKSKESVEEASVEQRIDPVPGEESVTDSTYSLEKLQEKLSSTAAEELAGLADPLLSALLLSKADAKTLTDSISKLKLSELGKSSELRQQLADVTAKITGLQAKLDAVVAAMRAQNLDVSKYAAPTGG